jgi:endonuclease-3 related protein
MNSPGKTKPGSADLQNLFDRLLSEHGPQHWWPAESDYEMIVGAILTQNTSWENVETALGQLKSNRIWAWDAVLETPVETLAEVIKPSGYFNQKARKLKLFAEFLDSDFERSTDRLFQLPLPELRKQLLAQWGIGPETADDIILYAAKMPVFVIDNYTQRLTGRLGWSIEPSDYEGHRAIFESLLPADVEMFNEFHALIDHHCNGTCTKTPKCGECGIADICALGKASQSP